MMNPQDDDIVKDFLVESYENLDQLDRDLVTLEKVPNSRETLSSIFRTIHTIKGTCGFLGFGTLESVAHAGENLLSKLRDGELTTKPDITTGLLSLVDAVREMLGQIEKVGHEGDVNYDQLVQTLVQLQEHRFEGSEAISQTKVEAPSDPATVSAEVVEPVVQASPETATAEFEHDAVHGAATADRDASSAMAADNRTGGVSESTIRVDVGLLDKLMTRVGELVLARNQILQFTTTLNDSAFVSTSQRLNLITTELQEGVMKTRMQPIGNIWGKFPRVVRDLAHLCGKQVRIEMEGKETELDKTIIEAIKDPLTHLVRNSVDHGIESPDVRLATGKPAEGCLILRAYHEGGQVNIEITDDGAGLNLDRIRQKGVERGLISQDQANRMSEREIGQLIFTPGFSTAPKVTNVSGRGVGMDVVRTNIEKIGGTVDIRSQAGKGTTINVKIPLTLAIIPALIVSCGGERYAIPQVNLLELVRLEGDQARNGVELLHGAPVYRLRGQLLPLVYLRDHLDLNQSQSANADGSSADCVMNIVVLRANDRQFGLVVDKINDTEEIVVKPLSRQMKSLSEYAGATIMGDGTVALILDVMGVAVATGLAGEMRDQRIASGVVNEGASREPLHSLLVVDIGDTRRFALPTSMVSRLEKALRSSIEFADGREVIQYRGAILPLVQLADIFGTGSADAAKSPELQIVVYAEQGRSYGLVVNRIVDVVDTELRFHSQNSDDDYLMGTAVIQQRVTDVLNLRNLARHATRTSTRPSHCA